MGDAAVLSAKRFDAVLFDKDGVLTETATLHAEAWKWTFDDFLRLRAETSGEQVERFDVEDDYRRYVDGKPRYDGVRSFLASRGIELAEGDPTDPPIANTVAGLGNRKNELVVELIETEGVRAFPGSVRLVEDVRRRGIRTAVVSSSANCRAVLRSAGIDHLFDTQVDGIVAAELGLPGKPAPDTFLFAARSLQVAPERAVVVEDALAGVEAGRAGGFGLVIGVDRLNQAQALRDHGADLVVADLGELVAPVTAPDP
ncbi:MAG: beta-phosphoglucomutase family hydrolase [Acidimicrobiia bacterium]